VVAPTIYGSIRYGKDIVTGKWVVIKECLIEKVGIQRSVQGHAVPEDVNMEIELHGRLCQDANPCPYIVELLEVCQDKEYIYIILEYAPKGDLYSYVTRRIQQITGVWKTVRNKEVKQRVVDEWQNNVRKWVRQLLLALRYMHERNICHRDISLENIVLTKDLDAKVIDLGVAHDYEDGNFSTECSRIGKDRYMSPECYLNQYYNGRDNDMWCVGVVLWLCLVGCPPWELPCVSDQRFVFVMRGMGGIKSLVTRWRRQFLVPDSAVDLMSRIFRPQKDRITVHEALRHPFITGDSRTSLDPDLYIPLAQTRYNPQRPDSKLSEKWGLFREKGKLTNPPAVWSKISQAEKDAIQKFLWSINKTKGSIFDTRVTQEMVSKFKMTAEEVHDILIYYMAASRNRFKMTDSNDSIDANSQKPKPSAVLKYHVSERKAKERSDDPQPKAKERSDDSERKAKESSDDSERKAKESSYDPEQKANCIEDRQEKEEEVIDETSSKDEDWEELNLMTAFHDQEKDELHSLRVKATMSLNQLKVDFALLGTRELNLPFIPPDQLELLADNEVLNDTAQLRSGIVLSGQYNFNEEVNQWFRELSQDDREKYFEIFTRRSQDYLTMEKLKQKFLDELSTKFSIKDDKCVEVWTRFSQESLELSNLEFREEVSLDGIAPEFEWLKLLSNDVFGRMFALILGNIVIANMGDDRATTLLEEKGLTRDKAMQAIEHFSQVLHNKAEDERENHLTAKT